MLDTNVLLSMLLFPGPRMNAMMERIFTEDLVLASFVVNELREVVQWKFPMHTKTISEFLKKISFELVNTPEEMDETLFSIRDPKDYAVLYSAILGNVDVLITGDKDFAATAIDKPEILTPAEFIDLYVIQ